MNKRQKQVIQSQLNDERATLNKLKGIYKKALDDTNDRLAALKGRAETENLQSIIYQIQYQEALKKQINGILDTLNGDQFSTISEYLAKSYESGFVGTMYDIHGQGVPLIFPIDQDQVVQAVTLDTKLSKPLYNKLGEDVNLLKKRVANNISRGIAQGQSYSDIAKNIAVGMVGNYARMNGGALYNAMRITRTEAHRISQQAAYDALKKAKDNGADVVKQWDATLDKRTRPSHARVDGEIRELDEPFSNGLMKPGDPNGRAAEVINCRCQLLQRARWALDDGELQTLKERAAYFGLDKTANFEEFRKKYMLCSKTLKSSQSGGKIHNIKQSQNSKQLSLNDIDDFEKWQEEYYKLNSNVSFSREDNPNIYEYTGGSYEAINALERGGKQYEKAKKCFGSDLSEYKKISEGISKELSKFKLNEPLILKRSVGDVAYITGKTSSVEDMKSAIGKIYTEKGFTSTTVCADAQLPFGGMKDTATTLEIYAPKSTKGAYIYKISDSPAEFEFLIDKNAKFKIIDAGERNITVKNFRGKLETKKERFMILEVMA